MVPLILQILVCLSFFLIIEQLELHPQCLFLLYFLYFIYPPPTHTHNYQGDLRGVWAAKANQRRRRLQVRGFERDRHSPPRPAQQAGPLTRLDRRAELIVK